MKKYEIWIGRRFQEMGDDLTQKPELIDIVWATSFRIACYIHVLENALDNIKFQMGNRGYIEDIHFGHLYYNPKENSQDWIGKFYKSEEEALESYKN